MSITMGNDEFILYIRKNSNDQTITNDVLGKRIWQWLEGHDESSVKTEEDQPCMWGSSEEITSATTLPKTAAQFTFSRNLLPQLYTFLDTIQLELNA